MQNKILYGSAAIALLTAFTTEAVLVYKNTQGAEIEKKAAFNADKILRSDAEITRLKAAIEAQSADYAEQVKKGEAKIEAQTVDYSEKVKKAETEIAALKAQLDAQTAINAELSKTAEESKRRAQAAAQEITKLRRAPVAPQPTPQPKLP